MMRWMCGRGNLLACIQHWWWSRSGATGTQKRIKQKRKTRARANALVKEKKKVEWNIWGETVPIHKLWTLKYKNFHITLLDASHRIASSQHETQNLALGLAFSFGLQLPPLERHNQARTKVITTTKQNNNKKERRDKYLQRQQAKGVMKNFFSHDVAPMHRPVNVSIAHVGS